MSTLETKFVKGKPMLKTELVKLVQGLQRERNQLREQLDNQPSGGCQEHEEIMRAIGHSNY